MSTPPRVVHTRASVAKRAEAEYRALDAIVRRLKPADFRRPVFAADAPVRWTVKDVLAHLTAWKWREVRRLTRDRGPLRPEEAPFAGATKDENRLIWERSRRTPAKTIVAEHRAVHRAFLKAVATAPRERFAARWSRTWPADAVGHIGSHRRMHLDPLFAPTVTKKRR